ncbi:MAG TPA: hypothetical protein ENH82_01125 [bacterium]|nr:hypothetical protein [bacterium]
MTSSCRKCKYGKKTSFHNLCVHPESATYFRIASGERRVKYKNIEEMRTPEHCDYFKKRSLLSEIFDMGCH